MTDTPASDLLTARNVTSESFQGLVNAASEFIQGLVTTASEVFQGQVYAAGSAILTAYGLQLQIAHVAGNMHCR